MTTPIVQTDQAVTLVGGGDAAPSDLRLALSHAPVLVAADGGAVAADALGRVPDAVIGDFDSIPERLRRAWPQAIQHPIPEQDSTDFDKCLRNIAAPLILAVGFTGARIDHQLAAFNTLVRYPGARCVMIGREEIVLAAPPRLRLDLEPGDVVSLFPLARLTARAEGLRWPLDGLVFEPDGRVGTSNAATGPVALSVDGPGMLVILPRRCLVPVLTALAEPGATWPAP